MKKNKLKFLFKVGNMYLCDHGVDVYQDNEREDYFYLIRTKVGGYDIRRKGRKFWVSVPKDFYEKYIDHEINSIELSRALDHIDSVERIRRGDYSEDE